MPISYSLYRSREQVSTTSSTYSEYIRNAIASGSERVYHYNAIPEGTKGIEPHIVLSSIAGSEDAPSQRINPSSSAEAASPLPDAAKTSEQADGRPGLPVRGGSLEAKPRSESSSATSHQAPEPVPATSNPGWSPPPSNIPQGRAEDMILWTDDDIDATDYKNMMDYDPDQDESIYESTTDSSTDATAPPPKKKSVQNSGYIESYSSLSEGKTTSLASEVSVPPLSGLLILFIPGPLTPLPASPTAGPPPTTPPEHATFLAHLARYPYLTSHENYIRHTGHVLSSSSSSSASNLDPDAPSQYLLIHEFSDLDLTRRGRKVGLNWKLKRQEAKHWWRKEERGAKGVKAGFFKLGEVEDVR